MLGLLPVEARSSLSLTLFYDTWYWCCTYNIAAEQQDLFFRLSGIKQTVQIANVQTLLNDELKSAGTRERTCDKCNRTRRNTTTAYVETPDSMLIHVRREGDPKMNVKLDINSKIEVTQRDVSGTQCALLTKKFYELQAVINKYGDRAGCGHYDCMKKVGDTWYVLDDNYVTEETNPRIKLS